MRHPVILAAFLTSVTGSAVAQRSGPLRLLVPGAPAPESVTGTWLGVYRTPPHGYELRSATIRLVPSRVCGSKVSVSAPQPTEPLLLLSGLPGLRAGPIDTAFRGYRFLEPETELVVHLRGRAYRLRASGVKHVEAYSTVFTSYELHLAGTGTQDSGSQAIVHLEFSGDNPLHVLLIGDLDRDGQPDLFLQQPGGGYSTDYVLYLSSVARPGDRVGRAAHLYAVDC